MITLFTTPKSIQNLLRVVLLTFCGVLFSAHAFADDIYVNGIYYNITSDSTCQVFKSSNLSYKAVIPHEVSSSSGKSYTVTEIGPSAFFNCSRLTSVSIPNSVTTIGGDAFEKCTSLTSVTIPNSVTTIGDDAFAYCTSLTSVTIPNSVTTIGNSTFSNCTSLTSVTIPNSVTTIGDDAFVNCTSLTSVTIPNSVTTIGRSTFNGCASLTSVTIPNSVTTIGDYAFSGCTSLTSVTIPNSVTTLGAAFYKCTSLTSVTISNSVTTIGNSAFYGCTSLTSILIPNSVTTIEDYAFAYCTSLTSVTIPNSVTTFGLAFYECTSLTSITIPNSVTTIVDYAFRNCTSLTSVTIPNSVTTIGDHAFHGCTSLKSVTIPDSVTTIGGYAFYGCTSLTSVTIPNSVTAIGHHAFYSCTSLMIVTLPNNVTTIGDYTFCGCRSLTSVTIPNSVTTIGTHAFDDCTSLTSVTIPNSVTMIGSSAFSSCTSLTSVTIPNSVTTIGGGAFYSCSRLISVELPNSLTSIGYSVFASCDSLSEVISHAIVPIKTSDTSPFSTSAYTSATLYVPEESIEAYRTSSYCWRKFQNIQPISNVNAPDSVTTLQEYLNTLPADGTEQTVNLDDYEPITEPITIPARLHVTITGSNKLTIGKTFQGDYLFKTERQAYLSFQVPDIVWEEGTTLPSIIFHAAGAGSEIHLDGADGNQIACTGTLIQVEDSAFVQVSTDIGGDVVRANPGGCIYIDKPNSSLDSYIKEIYLGEGRDFEIFGNIHFDAMTVSDTMYWNGRGTLDLPEKINLGPRSRIGLCADALSLSTVEFVMTEVPEERGYITMTTLGKGVDATKLRCTVPEGYSPRMTETAGANTTTQVVSIERVDADFNASFEALMQYLYQNLQTYADSLQDADSRINTLSDANLKDSLQTEVTYLGTLRAELYAAYNTLAQQHNLYYGARSVEDQYSYLQDCLTKMNVLQEQLLMMNYVINEQIALEQLDDLQDFINNVTKNDTIGTADNPVIIELPDSCSFSDITIHRDVYIVIRPSNRGGRPVVPLRPTPGKPAIKVEEGGHLTFEDLDIVCDRSGGGTQYVYVEGTLIVDENVTFTSATDEDVVVYVAPKGKSEWSGDLPQGRVENHGGFVQRAGIIDVYYNYGSHIIEGGQVHYVLNNEEFSSTAGTIGSTDSTSTRPAIVNYGTMHLEGGTVTGYGPTLIVHYHILYLDGVTLDDSHVEHTIEAHADFYTRGDIPFRHIELAQDVTVYILSSWTVIWHIYFIDGQLQVRRAIFASPGDYIPSNFREYIDCPLPAHYRWYCDDQQRAVEVRDEKVHDEDDLQAFIDGLADEPGTAAEPRLLDGENSIVPWSEIPMSDGMRHLHVQNITFTIPAEQATPCVWTIPSGSSVRLTQVTFEGGKRFSEREEHYLSVSGQLILGQTQFRHCHVSAYTPVYLSESLTDTLYLCLFDPKGALYEGAPAILPYADYTLTEADASRVVYPDQEEWGYRLGTQGTIELAPALSSALSDVQLSDVHIYVDTAGRLHVSGVSDNTPCRIFTIEGQLRYSGPLSGVANLSLDHGCYLLQVGDIVSKVVR